MEVELHLDSPDCRNSEHFCELCNLDFTTQNELEEHTWSMLHNTNLNRKQGRDCVHSCSLCKQEFVGLLEFTGHLHSDSHQEKLNDWQRDQQQEWRPDTQQHSPNQQQQQSPNQQQQHSPNQQQKNKPDWSTDDFSGFVDYFSDHGGAAQMGDSWRGGRGPARGSRDPRDIPDLFDYAPPQFGYRFQEQFDWERDARDQFQERHYPRWNEGGRDQPREFRDSPPPNPEYPGINYSSQENDRHDTYHWRQNSDERQNDRYYGNRDEDMNLSRGSAGMYRYPSDKWRASFDNDSQFKPRHKSQPYRHGNRNVKHNLPHNTSRQKRSAIGSDAPSRSRNERRPSSRNRKAEGTANNRQKEMHPHIQTQGRRTLKGKVSENKTPPKSSPSGSSNGKNTRKGTPRKLGRHVEEKKDKRVADDGDESVIKDDESSIKDDVPVKTMKEVKADNSKTETTVTRSEKVRTEFSKESLTTSQSIVMSAVKTSNSKHKEATTREPLCLTKLGNSQGDFPSSCNSDSSLAKGDSSAAVKGDSPAIFKGVSSVTHKEDNPSSVEGGSSKTVKDDSPTTMKGDSSLILKKDLTLSVMVGKEEKEFMNVSNKQKDSLLFVEDRDEPAAQTKGNKEQQPIHCQNSSETVNTLPVLSERNKDIQSSNVGEDSLSSVRVKGKSAPNPKNKSASSLITTKDKQDLSCFGENSTSMSENEKDKTRFSKNRHKPNDSASSSATMSTISSLPWEQREEKLRSLLGIKKEPKNIENQKDSTPCAMSKSINATTQSEAHNPVISSTVTSVITLSTSSVKPASSRYVPVFSQLSLSRPQCSFIHIDGVQCGAVTFSKYCSYHQRVFKNDKDSTQEQSVTSKVSHITREESRPEGTQVFRPSTPPYKPPESTRMASGSEEEIGRRLPFSNKYEKNKEKKELYDFSKGTLRRCDEINLNSVSPHTAPGAAADARSANIDLGTTIQGVSRDVLLHGSSTYANIDQNTIGASTGDNAGTSISANIDLSETVPRPGRTLALHDSTLDSDGGGPGIDLSGTVPNLEGLLALHGTSGVDKKSKTELKHGRWKHQGPPRDIRSNIDLGLTIRNQCSSVSSDSSPNIDLSEIIPQPGRSRTPHEFTNFDLKEPQLHQAATHSITSRFNSDALQSQKHVIKTEPGEERASASSVKNTEMIDLNFSTKLLGVPHSVVAPFNASIPSPKKPSREVTKSPSDFSNKSSNVSSPRSYAPSSPQSPSSSRRVSTTTPLSVEQSPGATISLPSLSLDLSRFNLPVTFRKTLAERFSVKKTTTGSSGYPVESVEGRRSQPLFSEHKTEGPFDPEKKSSPSTARLRGRGQRSISLDSPIVRRENLLAEGPSRLGVFERGNVFDANQFLSKRLNNEGHQQAGLHASDKIPESLNTGSDNVPSTRVPPFGVPSRNASSLTGVPTQHNSNELQSRGLIDLSSTSYIEGMSVPSINQGRMADGSRLTVDNLRSPTRPSVLQSRGLIDLNSSTEFGSRNTAIESSEALSVIKRKRLNSSEGSESASSLIAEKTAKRPKQVQADPGEDKPVTYRSGINIQELLSIERDEQNQLQNLHAVQSRLKAVRSQIQKLCTELDSLSSEEQRITLKMGELRNSRLSILESACYQRQMLPTRVETSTSTTEGCRDDSRMFTVSSESGARFAKTGTLGNVHKKADNCVIDSSGDDTSCVNVVKSPSSDYRDSNMNQTPMEVELRADSSACSSGDSCLNTSSSSNFLQPATQVSSVATAATVSKQETLHVRSRQPREKVIERLILASKRAANQSKSSNVERELNREATNNAESTAQISDLSVDIPCGEPDVARSSSDANPGPSVVGATLDDPVSLKTSESEQTPARAEQEPRSKVSNAQTKEQTRKDLTIKIKHLRLSENVLLRKKSFSDINVSKTIEASRKKVQSVRENMKRWKQQEDGISDTRVSHEQIINKHSSNPTSMSSTDSAENVSQMLCKNKQGPSSCKIAIQDKRSPRKTTKEFKKSSLFHSGKKNSKESRKHKTEKLQSRDKRYKVQDAVPSKRRKIDVSCNTQGNVPSKEKTSPTGMGHVVSAAAHTTTADLGGSGTDERANTEDEIPTRDVDSQSADVPSGVRSGASHLQIPSSTVEALKKTAYNPSEGKKHRGSSASTFEGHTGAVCGLKTHNGHLFTCSADKTTRSFNIQSGECVKVYQGHHQAVNCVEVCEDSDRLFTGSNDQTVRSYNTKSGVCTHKFTFDGRVMCLHAAFDLLFVGLSTGVVASIDLLINKLLERLHCHEPRGVSCLTTATEGQRKLLCCGSFDSTITIRDYKTGLLIRTFTHHNMTVLCLQVVNNILYSGSADMKVQAHNLNTGELLRSFHGHTGSVSGLQIVGRVLVTSCLDKLIRCYDLTTGDVLQVYGGQMDMIFSVLVNNGRIFSGGRDGSVVAAKLDLRVYHPCKWENCNLNFGIVSHLKNHIREYHVMEQGTVEACHWSQCGHQFSADDDIAAVLKHVLDHVVTRRARKSAS